MRMKIAACMMTLCLALLLTGCMERAADDVSNAVSRVESEAKDAASRVEDAGSRLGSAVESALDPDHSRDEDSSASPTPQPR